MMRLCALSQRKKCSSHLINHSLSMQSLYTLSINISVIITKTLLFACPSVPRVPWELGTHPRS